MRKSILFFLLFAVPSFAADYSGFFSSSYERDERFDAASSFMKFAANVEAKKLFMDELSFRTSGDYYVAGENETSRLDAHLLYFRYTAFQGRTDILAGRFALLTNRFLSLDGLQFAQVTPWYFGISAFVGAPNYPDGDTYRDEFRHTGDLAYGGKVFLSGVRDIKFNFNYYRETGLDDTDSFSVYKETVGTGGTYFKKNGEDFSSLDFLLDQDVYHGNLARASVRGTLLRGGFLGAVFGDYFDIRDDYPFGRELIIRLISSGRESRGGFNAAYDITGNVNVYAGFTYTSVELRSGNREEGQIYRLGTDLTFVKELGLSAKLEVYDYESILMRAYGVIGGFEWQFAEDFVLACSAEKAFLRDSSHDNDASSVEAKLLVYLTEGFSFSVFGQLGSHNRFVDKNRWGGELKYAF